MMKTNKMWLMAVIFLAFAAVSCDDDENGGEEVIDEAKLLVEYLEGPEGGNYANTTMPALKTAEQVHTDGAIWYLIDIRSQEVFDEGHVPGAVRVDQKEVLTHLEGTTADDGKTVVIICYSGQSAAWATSLLRMVGYDAYSMKFGMCSWNEATSGSWTNADNVGNDYANLFEDDNVAKGPEGSLPVLNTGKTTGSEIAMERVKAIFAEGFGEAAVGKSTVFGALEDYYIVNYWEEADYTKYGHVPGAMQYTPKEAIAMDTDLKTLPAEGEVVVYCWTGQTSANMAAYLRVIGYNAKSLTFGANGMIYDELTGHKFVAETDIKGYDLVTD